MTIRFWSGFVPLAFAVTDLVTVEPPPCVRLGLPRVTWIDTRPIEESVALVTVTVSEPPVPARDRIDPTGKSCAETPGAALRVNVVVLALLLNVPASVPTFDCQ